MDKDQIFESFANNPLMFDVIHRFILGAFADAIITSDMSNEIIGQKTRARLEGIATVEDAFRRLKNYKKVTINKPQVNPAR